MTTARSATNAWVERHTPPCPRCAAPVGRLDDGACPHCRASLVVSLGETAIWGVRCWYLGGAAIGFLAGLTLIVWTGVLFEAVSRLMGVPHPYELLTGEFFTLVALATTIDLIAILWFLFRRRILGLPLWLLTILTAAWWTPIVLILVGTMLSTRW